MSGLSLEELIKEYAHMGPMRAGSDWDGKLGEWLDTIIVKEEPEAPDDPDNPFAPPEMVEHWRFPTDSMKNEYLATISNRDDDEVMDLLHLFLFEDACLASDSDILHNILHERVIELGALPAEYERRLLRWGIGKGSHPNPGVRWCLDLIPHSPKAAVDVINAYINALSSILPDGRIDGLEDAMAIINARWLSSSNGGRDFLYSLSPRDFERLAAALYKGFGYRVALTPPSKDGGRDVIAIKNDPGQRDHALIECKAHTAPIGVEIARSLLGVVAHERANRGVLITTSRFTRGARDLAKADPRLELVDGDTLTRLLSEKFGSLWHQNIDFFVE